MSNPRFIKEYHFLFSTLKLLQQNSTKKIEMGRAKLNMELIGKEKSRNITFKKRKVGLIRKLHEFTTLCDVRACMIIYGPKQEKLGTEPDIWPQNLNEVRSIIEIYKSKKDSSNNNKMFGLSDFFRDRKRKIEEELTKLKRKNMEAKYPTTSILTVNLTETQLREFVAQLSDKAAYVRSRIEMLKRNRDTSIMDFGRMSQFNPFYTTGFISQQQQAIAHVPKHYPIIDQKLQDVHPVMNQNSMMTLFMRENDKFMQFGGAGFPPSHGGNIQFAAASFKREVIYESGRDTSLIYANPGSMARYYPSLFMPPVMQQPCVMQGKEAVPLGLTFSADNHQEVGGAASAQEDVSQYFMNNVGTRFHD